MDRANAAYPSWPQQKPAVRKDAPDCSCPLRPYHWIGSHENVNPLKFVKTLHARSPPGYYGTERLHENPDVA